MAKTDFGKQAYNAVVLDGPKVMGMVRVVGNRAIHFGIQDIVVHPSYNSKSISSLIMGLGVISVK